MEFGQPHMTESESEWKSTARQVHKSNPDSSSVLQFQLRAVSWDRFARSCVRRHAKRLLMSSEMQLGRVTATSFAGS
eukprot:2633728-Amphidinium_carterae.1